jgi:GR25 family glycosyltransferase involved in LPS biosynthesis
MIYQEVPMLRIISFCCIIAFTNLYGSEVEDYFKIPSEKPNAHIHSIKNIDFIYMINLDQRPEKFEASLDELAPFNIIPYRFSAVNGWELPFDALNKLGVKYEPWMRQGLMGTSYLPEDEGTPSHEIMQVVNKNYFCHCMARGTIGIALSHLSVLKDAYDSGYETIWVMEDDIEVLRDPHILSELIQKLDSLVGKDGWDFLFTDMDTKGQNGAYVPCLGAALRPNFNPSDPYRFQYRENIDSEFRTVGARYGAYSVIVRRSGMKTMLDFMKDGIFLPYDMEYTLPDNIRMFTVLDDVVSTMPQALSDNGAPNYKQKLLQKKLH